MSILNEYIKKHFFLIKNIKNGDNMMIFEKNFSSYNIK